jgi:hypothetical protein
MGRFKIEKQLSWISDFNKLGISCVRNPVEEVQLGNSGWGIIITYPN